MKMSKQEIELGSETLERQTNCMCQKEKAQRKIDSKENVIRHVKERYEKSQKNEN